MAVLDQMHRPDEHVDHWETALWYLREGNTRYLNNQTTPGDTHEHDRNILKHRQHPFAVIIACSDSRAVPEIYFNQKLGDIFVIRNAGNIADLAALGSIEYAVGYLNVTLVVVVGHSQCGAVTVAYCDDQIEYPSHFQSVLDKIRSSIDGVPNLETAIQANILKVVKQIQENETVLKAGAKVVGACYDIVTGKVDWL